MVIKTDKEAQMAVESLCHSAMVNCPREAFTQNLAFVIKMLSAVEIEEPELVSDSQTIKPPKEPDHK